MSNFKSLLTDQDVHLFEEGTHSRLADVLGAHLIQQGDQHGTYFAVWAPNARSVSLIGEFNGWDADANPLTSTGRAGIWELFVPGILSGAKYKYRVTSLAGDYTADKADPMGFRHELSPQTASVVWDLNYEWHDQEWMSRRQDANSLEAPMSIYEVHLGSWRRVADRTTGPFHTGN